MRRFIAILLALMLCLTLAACGQKPTEDPNVPEMIQGEKDKAEKAEAPADKNIIGSWKTESIQTEEQALQGVKLTSVFTFKADGTGEQVLAANGTDIGSSTFTYKADGKTFTLDVGDGSEPRVSSYVINGNTMTMGTEGEKAVFTRVEDPHAGHNHD